MNQLSLRQKLLFELNGKEKTLPEIYESFPREKRTTIRGRLNEAIDQYFKRIGNGTYTAIVGRFQVVYADPAWEYSNKSSRGAAEDHYSVMKLDDIKNLPVKELCKKDAVLFLWATPPLLKEALEVMESWGFTYKTVAFVWIKLNKDGTPFMGMGNYTRANAELCLLGTKQKGVKVQKHNVSQIVQSIREIHSKKPSVIYRNIEELHGDCERLELFARTQRENWTCWGNELSGETQETLRRIE